MELEDSTFLTSDYTTKLHHRHNMVLAQKQKHRPIEQDRKPRNKPTNLLNLWIVFGSLVIFTILNLFMLNKQGDNIPPWHTPFPIWNQSVVPCRVLIIASWPAYRFLRRQVWWSGICISFRIFQFVVIHIVKGFDVVNKAKVDAFLELWSCGAYTQRNITQP